MEFNRGTEKFVSVLDKKLKKMQREFTELVENNLSKKVSLELILSTKSNEEIFLENSGTKENIDRELKIIRKTNPELEYRFNKIKWVHYLITEGHAFNEYDVLESLFEEFNFEPKYRIEVLGYLLKHAATAFLELNEELEEQIQKKGCIDKGYIASIFTKELERTNMTFSKEIINYTMQKMLKENYMQDIFETIERYKIVDKFIDENGNFIGKTEVEQLAEALTMKQIRMTESQKDLIVKTILAKASEQQKKESKVEVKEETSPVVLPSKREQHQAALLLKRLLDEDMPKEYVDEDTIKAITNAMLILNYPDKNIAKIQKNIICNNTNIESDRIKKKLAMAKSEFLNPTQLNLFDSVEKLINSNEPLINSFYEKIVENQEFIKRELMNMYDNKSASDDVNMSKELIELAFEELKSAINSYCYSDYRFVLELTKKEGE